MAHVRGHIVKGGIGGAIVKDVEQQLNHSSTEPEIINLDGVIHISEADADRLADQSDKWFMTTPQIPLRGPIDSNIIYAVDFSGGNHTHEN